MKEHYEAILAESASKVDYAREQLTHIRALLDDQLLATTVARKPARSTRAKATPSVSSAAPTSPSLASPPSTAARSTKAAMKLPLLPPYDRLSKIDATAAVFQECQGQVLHIDDVIEHLYGHLNTSDLKAERTRMKDVMVRGMKRGLWTKVHKVPLSYIMEGPASDQTQPQPPKSRKRKSTPKRSQRPKPSQTGKSVVQLEVLPPYQDKGMTIAVEDILRDHQGQAMTAEDVAYILYGELNPQSLAVAKKRLHDIFSKGVKQNRWQRLSDRKGAYMI